MAKIFLISINLIIVFALKIFFGGDVEIEQKMQEIIKPGETLNVTLEITKGDREGFAKWQQTLPDGFIASSVEMNGATFSFKNQDIKVIWMEMPKAETFTIQYKIETSESVLGEHNLSGKFSFIEENERRDINSELFILTIDGEAMAKKKSKVDQEDSNKVEEIVYAKDSESNSQTKALNTTDSTNNTAVVNPTKSKSLKSNSSNQIAPAANSSVLITRDIKHIEGGSYEVTLTLNKNGLKSFGKVEDFLPPNYSATELESGEGIFSFKNNVVKILWMTLPENQGFEVKYALQSNPDGLDSAIIHGVFSYLDKDQSIQSDVAPTKFKNFLVEEQIADAINKNNSSENESINNNPIDQVSNTESEAILASTQESIPTSNEELTRQITNIPAPESAIAYKIQIAASHKEVNQKYFIERHNINEPVAIEFHKTWYKYTVGSFPIYKEARDKRNQVWAENNKINDAFVTAYNSGERISVQEALMISQQKWFK
ncbi:hypothetical protein N9515_00445 [Vicingaceae bacterium]|nr:hypothetical protein [Vicingaceae bacterium]MDB4060408.1 hypothetical protein [Vicingaceae bacterium]